MALLLIRHGETDLNAARVVQFPHTPLGDNGLSQAEQLGLSLRTRTIDLILTSDYTRARMTAERVAQHVGAELTESAFLRERNFGDIRGTAYDELGDIDIFAPEFSPPGGESWDVFHSRVDQAWEEVTARAQALSGDLVVITHGLVLRSLFERILDVSTHEIESDMVVANTSVTVVDHGPPWQVVELASVAHLSDGPNDVAPA
jgi:probable phosphoglycerate mutase